MTLDENKSLVRRFNDDAFNRRDLEARDRFLGQNFAVNGVVVDRAQARARVAALFTAFPDFHRALEDIVAEGDKVVARYTARGTHQGEFMGIPATGKRVTFRWITIYRLGGTGSPKNGHCLMLSVSCNSWARLHSPAMILRLTPKTAALVGETPAEWQLLEKQVRAGRWTCGPRGGGPAPSARGGARGAGAGGRRGGVETAATSTAYVSGITHTNSLAEE
jgi:steroid delta-isomerase-like uncharacterized protein